MASGYKSSFARSTEKTVSYKQLKSDFGNILKEHGELQTKLSRQQTQLYNAKSARKRLEKETQELKENLNKEEKMHKEAVTEISGKLGASNAHLQSKVEAFERELEKLGIDPVCCTKLPAEDSSEERREVKKKLDSLITNLNSSVTKNEILLDQFQEIMDQCKILQEEANAQTEVVT